MTRYTVLFRDDPDGFEQFPVTYVAASPEAAIRKAADEQQRSGEYVAVPARSWHSREVSVTTEQVAKVSLAKEKMA